MLKMENLELVSVCIITYNSSKYILETLESVKNQTYPKIELIISDDASSDETVSICEQWLDQNKNRFTNTKLIASTQNTGVCGNINRANGAAKGRWIKGCAGDDCLMPDAIASYVEYCHRINCQICVSDAYFINEDSVIITTEGKLSLWNHYIKDLKKPKSKQKSTILYHLLCPGPPMFMSKEVWMSIGGCNEKYAYADEWVMQYSMLQQDYYIYPLEKKLIKYRVSQYSLCHNPFETRSYDSQFAFVMDIIIPDLLKKYQYLQAWDLFIKKKTQCLVAHNKNFNYKYLLLFSPRFILERLKDFFV